MAAIDVAVRPGWPRGLERAWLVLAGAAVVLGHAWLATSRPLVSLALTALCIFLFFERAVRSVLVIAVLVGPVLNPPLLGLGASGGGAVAGRVYVIQGVLLLVAAGALVAALRGGMLEVVLQILVLIGVLIVVQTVGRTNAGFAWVYRPLQPFLVAFSVRALYGVRSSGRLLLALAWGSAAGCALASVHALVPSIDPFALSRPGDLPFVSFIGSFTRATGAFTYPNNLGTFAAYATLLGLAAWLLDRPVLPRGLSLFLMISGSSALLLSGSRAAGLGLVCGAVFLTVRANPRRRSLLVTLEAVAGIFLVLAVLGSPTAREVAGQRLDSAAGESLTLRVGSWQEAVGLFRASPIVGTGAAVSRIDNFWLLYLAQGGIVGAAVLLTLARVTLRPHRRPKAYPELWAALLVALCASGLLQDSLGQTLTTWFLGALIGISILAPEGASEATSTRSWQEKSSHRALGQSRPAGDG